MTETKTALLSTDKAAALMGLKPSYFPTWARRRRLEPARRVRLGRSTIALWDMDQVFDAEQREPDSWRKPNPTPSTDKEESTR